MVRRRERAAKMAKEGYLWNSGIFAWRVGDFLDDVRQYTPDYTSTYDVRSIFNRAVYFGGVLTLTGN